ncbi:VapE domain-containing protein [Streptococcus sp. FT1-106]|uniref:VapE domain-containing protein n=1 Tax=Streptococcus sp. FT1-106 TaxID=3409994 RepID=UPI003BF5952F
MAILFLRHFYPVPVSIDYSFVFSRTTNDFEHLNDATGDRRFLPMRVLKKRKEQPNTISDKDRLAIWGNYYRSYLANPVLFYAEDSKEGKIIETEREKYKIVDDDIERLEWYLETKIPKDFYEPTTFPYQRKSYYYDLEQYGKAYKTTADKERGIEWESIVARTKVTTNAVMEELFSELSETQKAKARKKTRLYLNSNPRWEKKENVRLGFKVSSGWERATKKPYK